MGSLTGFSDLHPV